MSDSEITFEIESNFEQGDIAGNVRLGKFESQYEELFAEVIEDGIITTEERARLDKVADNLGLDRMRLRKLEQALQAAYEARHDVTIRELADEEEPRASLMPLAPATDQRTLALERRVKALEARIVDLERELEEARAHVSVEIDMSDVGAPAAATVASAEDDPADLARRVRHDPRDVESLHGLYRVHTRAGELDRRWCTAHALAYLGAANDDERQVLRAHKTDGLIRPSSSVSLESWTRLLFHPEEEVLTGLIFGVVTPAVLLGRVSALRRDKALVKLDPARKQDPVKSTLQGVRCFSWGAAILGMSSPPFYADPDFAGAVEMVPGVPPASRLGKQALSGRTPFELAFLAGRHLSWYREEHFVRLLVPSIPDLEDIFLAALSIGNPGLPLSAEMKHRVGPISRAIEPVLEPAAVDRLRGHFLRFVEEGGRTNLQRWAMAADRTASRAGLLLASDLGAAEKMLALEDPAEAKERMDDLLVFVTSDRYTKLRAQIGIAVTAS